MQCDGDCEVPPHVQDGAAAGALVAVIHGTGKAGAAEGVAAGRGPEAARKGQATHRADANRHDPAYTGWKRRLVHRVHSKSSQR